MTKYKKPLLFALAMLPIAAAAGALTGCYQLELYSEEALAQITAQLGSTNRLIAVSAVQAAVYAFLCGFFGYILSNKVGLWKPIRLEGKKLTVTALLSVAGGILFSLDYWIFGSMVKDIQTADLAGMTVQGVLASVLYGGIIEELMMRLFLMSLLALLLWKLFYRKCEKEQLPTRVFVMANLLAAALFAAGHLPATISAFGTLTPLLVFRCFLLNGGFALVFGWLYRKYGIVYAMTSHALFHLVSKLIWLIFVL